MKDQAENPGALRSSEPAHPGQPQKARYLDPALLATGLGLAIAIRLLLVDFKSIDYFGEVIQSYPAIRNQGFPALASAASNYNPPYFYLLFAVARLLPQLPMPMAVKLPAMVADFVCAFFVYLIVKLKYPNPPLALWAGMAVLLAPTVVANSAFWGQVDSLHTACLTACVYFLLTRKPALAMLAFALGLAFKLQAIFLMPLILALMLRREIPWRSLLLIPAVLFLAVVPAWIAGRPLWDLLTIYLRQTSQYEILTLNAPTLYTWVPDSKAIFHVLYLPGLLLGVGAAFLLVVMIWKGTASTSVPLLLELSLLSLLVVPFFLPKMHDRYFFPADVLSVAFAFYFPQFFYIPLLVIGVSSLSYLPFLFNVQLVPPGILTFALLAAISILAYDSARRLYGPKLQTAPPGLQRSDHNGIGSQNGEPA